MRRSPSAKKQSLQLKVSEAKARFSHCLQVAKNGGEVVVMDRTVPVAKIVAIEDEKNGIHITTAVGNIADLAKIKPLVFDTTKPGYKSALELLFEDRHSGF